MKRIMEEKGRGPGGGEGGSKEPPSKKDGVLWKGEDERRVPRGESPGGQAEEVGEATFA